ncbi:hypothetical protein JW926_01275, partial [Candidatus Sumerlaeota bacterium]|nr:hypothetical protein [Candidatus Sumerlaeota bacterium]
MYKIMNRGFLFILFILLGAISHGEAPEKTIIVIPGKDVTLGKFEKTDYPSHIIVDQALHMSKNNQGQQAIAILEDRLKVSEGYDKGYVKSRLGYVNLNSGNDLAAWEAFREIVDGKVSAQDDIKCDALLRSAYLQMRMKNDEKALDEFKKIVSGEFYVDSFTAADAAMRTGALLKRLNRSKDSMEVFWQIAEKCPFKDDSDFARLQVAGILWEWGMGFYKTTLSLVERKSYYNESIKVCDMIINDPTVRDEIRAITELIHLEDFFFLGEYGKARELGEKYLEKWTPRLQDMKKSVVNGKTWSIHNCPRRQVLSSQMWMGMIYFNLEQYQDCIEMCHKVNSDMWNASDPYKNFNVF